MSFNVGDWVVLTRSVDGAPAGTVGKITSTGFVGGLDITLDGGKQLRGVSPDAVAHSAPGRSSGGDLGCAVAAVALVSAAAAVAGAVGWWGA